MIQVAILDSTQQVFIKHLSYASTNLGIGRGEKHVTLFLVIRNLSFGWGARLTHIRESENTIGRVRFVPKPSGSFYCGDIRKERDLCELKQSKKTF